VFLRAQRHNAFGPGRDPQQVEQIRGRLLRVEPHLLQLLAHLRGDDLGGVRVGDPTELAQQVEHRQIRRGAIVRETVSFAVGHGPAGQAAVEFFDQP
jgi:hypothetical protein